MENTFLQSALAQYQGKIMWQTNQQEVSDCAALLAACNAGSNLKELGMKIAQLGLSDHDRKLLGAMYQAKQRILQESGNWNLKEVEPMQ